MTRKLKSKAQSRATTIDQLPIAQSRVEEYLSYLSGKSTVLADLPKPQSRTEEFLEFLCYNGGIGGGTGGMTEQEVLALISSLLKDVSFDVATKQLTFFKEDGSTKVVDLSSLVLKTEIDPFFKNATFSEATNTLSFEKENGQTVDVDLSPLTNISWNNLEHAFEYTHINLMNYNEKVTGYSYLGSGDTYRVDNDWSVFFLDVQAGEQYTVYRKQDDNSRYIFTDSVGGRKLNAATVNTKYPSDEYVGTSFTVPNTPVGISKVAIQFNHNQNTIKDIMVFEGVVNRIDGFVPYTDKKSIQIEKEVSLEFDGTGTDLKSQTIHSAIIEVNNKIPKEDDNKVFNVDDNSWDAAYFRIPSLVRTQKGTLLGFGDIRYNTASDHSFINSGCARSTDNGLTWDYRIAAHNDGVNPTYSRVMDSTAVVTNTNKVLLLLGSWNDNNAWTSGTATPKPDWDIILAESKDDGVTWAQRSIKDACANVPSNKLGWLGGVGAGIVLKHGQHRNRIVLPTQIALRSGSTTNYYSCCIYSDNDGATWTMSAQVPNAKTSENMILELNSGELIMSSRKDGSRSRDVFISSDGGATWSVYAPLTGVFTHGLANGSSSCQGSWIKYVTKNGHEIGLASYPKNTLNSFKRDNITIYMYDFTQPSGIRELLVPYPKAGNQSGAGYSCLNYGLDTTGKEYLSILFEDDGNLTFKDITYLLETIEDITLSEQKCSWQDLDNVIEIKEDYTFENLFADDPKWTGKTFLANGNQQNNTNYRARAFRVQYGKTYRFMNVRGENHNTVDSIAGSATCVEFNTSNNTFNSTTRVADGRWAVGSDKVCGRSYLEYTPTSPNVTHISINLQYRVLTDVEDEIMVWDASVTPHKPYIPGTQTFTKSTIINGDKVETEFNSLQGLTSTKLKEALEELSNRITNSGGGTLTSINNQTGANGNIDLSISETNEALKLNVSGTEVSQIQYLTEVEVDEISKNLFTYLR